ncbi:hypothetical protein B0H19DRAFT_1136709 [Mycena capillaripes]|nr:hypothetical protein B0H19DRAFT_1136709 [Mycena capillaripes]
MTTHSLILIFVRHYVPLLTSVPSPIPYTLASDAFPLSSGFMAATALPSLAVNLHLPIFTSPNHPRHWLSRCSRLSAHKGRPYVNLFILCFFSLHFFLPSFLQSLSLVHAMFFSGYS